MPDRQIDWAKILEGLGVTRTLVKGEALFHTGEPASSFFLVVTGQLTLTKTTPKGRDIAVRRVEPGDIFGEVMMFTDHPFPVTAVATKDSKLIQYPRPRIMTELKTNSDLSSFFIKVLASRCLMLNEKVFQHSLKDLPSRLAIYLLELLPESLSETKDNPLSIELPVSKKELASQLGTVPETLSRAFKKLHEQKILKTFGKTVVFLNISKLQSLI